MSTIDELNDNQSELTKNKINNLKAQEDVASTDVSCDISVSQHHRNFNYNIAKQMCLLAVWICLGMSSEMSGATLPDLKNRIGVNYEEIARLLVCKSVGEIIGSILAGVSYQVLNLHTDLPYALTLVMSSVTTILIPWSPSLPAAAVAFCLLGIGEGFIDIGCNTVVMHLWGEKGAAATHCLHFGYGFGALIAPQIARPFLAPIPQNESMVITEDLSRIEIPYGIVGGLIFLVSLFVLGFHVRGEPEGYVATKKSLNLLQMLSPGSCASGHVLFGSVMFTCLSLFFVQAVGGTRAYGNFLFAFAYESRLMDKNQASLLQSVFWSSYTLARLLSIPLAKCVPLTAICIGDVFLAVLSASILTLFGSDVVTILWVFTVFMGMAIAVAVPNGMAWANLHLEMNSVGVMVLGVTGSCGGFIYDYLTGYLFETKGPKSLMYVMLGYALALGASYTALTIVYKMAKFSKCAVTDMKSESSSQ